MHYDPLNVENYPRGRQRTRARLRRLLVDLGLAVAVFLVALLTFGEIQTVVVIAMAGTWICIPLAWHLYLLMRGR